MNANSSRSHAVFTLDIRLSYSGLGAQINTLPSLPWSVSFFPCQSCCIMFGIHNCATSRIQPPKLRCMFFSCSTLGYTHSIDAEGNGQRPAILHSLRGWVLRSRLQDGTGWQCLKMVAYMQLHLSRHQIDKHIMYQ